MPLYEYVCLDCGNRFDTLRSMKAADDPIACTCSTCQSEHTSRLLSLFFAHSDGRSITHSTPNCSCCSAGSCATCNQN